MRLFVSVDFPDDLAAAVAEVQEYVDGASGVRCTDPEQTHVTLKFLGEVPESAPDDRTDLDATVRAIEAGVNDADSGPFEVAVAGLGAFPSPEYISVLWLGFDDGAEALTELHERIEARAVAAGFDPEEHEFTPHATLARMNDARGKEHVQRVLRETDPTIGSFRVEQLRLKESVLTDDGPRYSTVARFAL